MSATSPLRVPRRPQWTFGDRLRKVRRESGLTQAEFAAQLGVNPSNIDAWEQDRNKPRDLQGMAERIEDVCDIRRGWMLGYADPAPDDNPGKRAWRDSNAQPSDPKSDGFTPLAPVFTLHRHPGSLVPLAAAA